MDYRILDISRRVIVGAYIPAAPAALPVHYDRPTEYRYFVSLYTADIRVTPTLLSVSSVSITKRLGENNYLAVTIPNGISYSDSISVCLGNLLTVTQRSIYINGDVVDSEIGRCYVETVDADTGASAMSVTLSGYLKLSYTATKTVSLLDVSKYSIVNSKKSVSCWIDPALVPGDTVTHANDLTGFVASTIQININTTMVSMTVTE